MNIVFLANHCCIRVQKMALPLMEKGHHVHLISRKLPHYHSNFTTVTLCDHAGQYMEAIKLLAPIADLFHCHNEPSYYVTMVKEICDKPVILDVHDSFAARSTAEEATERLENGHNHIRITTEERNNFQLADGLVFPAWSFAEVVRKEFGLTQPHLVLPSMLPRNWHIYDCAEWLGGLVYEGRVDLKAEIAKHPVSSGFKYTDYEGLAQKAQEIGLDFHLYAGRDDKPYLNTYEKISFTHAPQEYPKLLKCISRHDWGLVGNLEFTPEWDVALPNKLFEYVAACVPVVAINAKESAEFIGKHGIGITVNSLEGLCERWGEHRQIRQNLIKMRPKLTMCAHIHELEEFYDQVINGR
jgi:hypothetical protein